MKQLIAIIVFSLIGTHLFSQDLPTMLNEADKLEKKLKEGEALKKYQEIVKIQSTNLKALWKCSELSSRIGNREKDKTAKHNYFASAQTYAESALKSDSTSSDANYAMAMALGYLALELKSTREKVSKINEVKIYADKSIKYNDANPKAWFVLGRWHFEVASLTAVEKSAVKLFYGGLPLASYNEAIKNFQKAAKLDKYFVANSYIMAMAYFKLNDKVNAMEVLQKLIKMPTRTEDDETYKADAKRVLLMMQ